MPKRFKWIKRLLMLAGAVALLIVLGYFLLLPIIARAQVARIFRDLGIAPASFELQSVSLGGLDLAAIDLGAAHWATAETVSIDYTLQSLWNGRVHTIEIENPRWHWKVRDGRIDFGPAAFSTTEERPLLDVPFDRIIVRNLAIDLDWNGRTLSFSADALVTRQSPGQFEMKLDARLAGSNLSGYAVSSVDLTGSSISAQATAFIPTFELGDAAALRDFIPALANAEIAGKSSINANLLWKDGQLTPRIDITASDVKLARPDWPIAIESAAAAFTIDNLNPIHTPADQRLTIHKAKVGALDMTDGTILFSIDSFDRINVAHAKWSMGEYGTFAAAPFTFNPSHPTVATTIAGEDIDLGRWLVILTDNRATAEGRLAGAVEFTIDPQADNRIALGAGALRAQPSFGAVQIADADLIAGALDQTRPAGLAAEQWTQAKMKMRDALRDYEFTMLRIDFIPQNGQVLCRIQTAGQGRQRPDPLQFGLLTINIRNFNDQLNDVLRLSSAWGELE